MFTYSSGMISFQIRIDIDRCKKTCLANLIVNGRLLNKKISKGERLEFTKYMVSQTPSAWLTATHKTYFLRGSSPPIPGTQVWKAIEAWGDAGWRSVLASLICRPRRRIAYIYDETNYKLYNSPHNPALRAKYAAKWRSQRLCLRFKIKITLPLSTEGVGRGNFLVIYQLQTIAPQPLSVANFGLVSLIPSLKMAPRERTKDSPVFRKRARMPKVRTGCMSWWGILWDY